MPILDGFRLLECISLEMDIPVVMMSEDSTPAIVLEGIENGASDFLTKPVRTEELATLWQHVLRKKLNDNKALNKCVMIGNPEEHEVPGNIVGSSVANDQSNDQNVQGNKRHIEDAGGDNEGGTTGPSKKQQIVRTSEIQHNFKNDVNQISVSKCVPEQMVKTMNIIGVTSNQAASHQQFDLGDKRYAMSSSLDHAQHHTAHMPSSPLVSLQPVEKAPRHRRLQRTQLSGLALPSVAPSSSNLCGGSLPNPASGIPGNHDRKTPNSVSQILPNQAYPASQTGNFVQTGPLPGNEANDKNQFSISSDVQNTVAGVNFISNIVLPPSAVQYLANLAFRNPSTSVSPIMLLANPPLPTLGSQSTSNLDQTSQVNNNDNQFPISSNIQNMAVVVNLNASVVLPLSALQNLASPAFENHSTPVAPMLLPENPSTNISGMPEPTAEQRLDLPEAGMPILDEEEDIDISGFDESGFDELMNELSAINEADCGNPANTNGVGTSGPN